MAQRNFTFVNRTGDPASQHERDEDLLTIRSHAMREVHRRRGLTPPMLTQPKPKLGVKDSNRSRPLTYASQPVKLSLTRTFSNLYSGTAIESDTLPSNGPRHLDYFLYGFTPLTFPTNHVPYECDIMRIAMSEGNPALLHALCAVSAIHQALVLETMTADEASKNKSEMRKAFLYHKQCAVVLLQRGFSKSVGFQTTSSLATVALLLMIESLSGDIITADTHKSGLLALAKRFGGTKKPTHFMVSDLLMSDMKSATLSLSRPSLKPCVEWLSDFDRLKHLPYVPCRPDLASLGSSLVDTKLAQLLGLDFVLLMCAMRNLINALEHSFDTGSYTSDINGTHFLVLEHELLSFSTDASRKDILSTQVTECCRIGALLYCNLFLWNWPKNATLVENLLPRLQTAISQLTPDAFLWEQPHVMVWLYFLGSFATSIPGERQWYMKRMKHVSEGLKIQEEDHLRSILSSLFYTERFMGQHLKECYLEISKT